ncbi:hypothetical protein [Marinobacterium sediminicola]|uniref:Uncharacterized protein n=1 Tax=Marinobacterium sediminicola TaxID=518898 RepID=A0ABY1RWL7_9GAMM|nr:hypothetical protein [Marinobacterium sediminicola]ULG70391.1 hypothetical protein LN244_06135 [Marinobacterium sediminicola]SMR69514.1 hypothetical protein SAMN04487964_101273 [Marinobacterium sediminicola]
MLGHFSDQSHWFLLVLMSTTTLFFALPIFIAPHKWAKLMLWKIPAETDLSVYFGRCLGAFILVVELLMLRGILDTDARTFVFDTLYAVFFLMLVVHIYGAFKRIQPITETLEIGLWSLLLVLNTLFYPAQQFSFT